MHKFDGALILAQLFISALDVIGLRKFEQLFFVWANNSDAALSVIVPVEIYISHWKSLDI